MKRFITTGIVAGLFALAFVPSAGATFPGGAGLIAATSDRAGNNDIYTMDRSGGMQTALTTDPGEDFDPAWSPDGTKIAFVSNRDGDNEIYVMNADGTGQTRITTNAGDDMDPAWSPDGQRLAIRRDIGGNNEIFLIDSADGGNPVNLTGNAASDFEPDFSPDGTKIAFQRYTSGSGTGLGNEVMLMNVDGSDQTNLTENDNSINDGRPSFSPDGTEIAFDSNREDSVFQIYTYALADGQITRVISASERYQQPAFAPDGSAIAAQTDGATDPALASIDPLAQTAAAITTGQGEADPSWQADDIAPTVTIDSGPAEGSSSSATDPSFGFSADEPGSTFECQIDDGGFSSCTSPLAASGLVDGPHSFSVRATDIAGNVSEPVSRNFTVDTVAPVVSFDSTPDPVSGESDASFNFSANEPVTGAECNLDGGGWFACSSPVAHVGLTDGPHTFQVRVTDAAGLVSQPVEYSWTIDATPSTATIVSGPENPTAELNAWFQFTSDDPDATFECRIDPGSETAWTPCVSGVGYENLTDGTHLFQVRSVEPAGPGPVAEASWTIDTVAPRLSITAEPASLTTLDDATFEFEMNKPGFTFECQLDADQAQPCSSPHAINGLAVGDHSLLVSALDQNGQVVDSLHRHWQILADPPVATITSDPGAVVASRSSAVKFTADLPEAVFECSFDEGPWSPCTSPAAPTSSDDGPAKFSVRAMLPGESAGPVATTQWVVDTLAPSVTIAGGPDGRGSSSEAGFTISADDPSATVSCRVDDGAWANCPGSLSLTGLADGGHVLRVMASDDAGNTGWARRDWSVDTTGPVASFGSGPEAETSSRSARFTFASSEGGSSFECRLDGGAWEPCTSPRKVDFVKLGTHGFRVRATDDLGNTGQPVARSWKVVEPAPRGLRPKLKTFKRIRLNRRGIARVALVKCPEGRCSVSAPLRLSFRLKGRKFTPGVRSPRGFYRERFSEIMLTLSPGAARVIANHGPARVKLRLKVSSDNGKTVTRTVRVTLTARR